MAHQPNEYQEQNLVATAAQLQNEADENDLHADERADDIDSACSDIHIPGSCRSLSSSITQYPYENGRRYHKYLQGAYPVPNDDDEQERMDVLHHVYSLALQEKLHLAPLDKNIQRALDLGTGTGIWAVEFAYKYPSAEVVGNDLSPIQPGLVPPNCIFEVDDFEAEWLFKEPFDYIHARELGGCVADTERLFQQIHKHLVPGGYIELQAIDPRFLSDDDTSDKAEDARRWASMLCQGMEKLGKPIDCTAQWADKLRDAGFVNIQEQVQKIPIGTWPKDPAMKEIGKYQRYQQNGFVQSYTPGVFTRAFDWSQKEVDILMANVKSDLSNPSAHLYVRAYFIWAMRP